MNATVGDAVALEVVETFSDGSTKDVPLSSVTWTSPTTVTALNPDSTADSPIPAFGAMPTAIFINNLLRPDHGNDLNGVVFVLDPGTASGGTVEVSANVTGESMPLTASISVAPLPAGNAAHGATVYSARCAVCHGTTAAGSPADPSSTTFTIDGMSYDFPAPGLDTDMGNLGSDPDWNAALLAMAARTDMDNGGLELRRPMPDWLISADSSPPLTTQDFADVYAWLITQ